VDLDHDSAQAILKPHPPSAIWRGATSRPKLEIEASSSTPCRADEAPGKYQEDPKKHLEMILLERLILLHERK
jgi:hypothetical protein